MKDKQAQVKELVVAVVRTDVNVTTKQSSADDIKLPRRMSELTSSSSIPVVKSVSDQQIVSSIRYLMTDGDAKKNAATDIDTAFSQPARFKPKILSSGSLVKLHERDDHDDDEDIVIILD